MTGTRYRTRSALALALVLALGATSCAGDDDDDGAATTSSTTSGAITTSTAPAATVDYRQPGQATRIGSGIVLGATLDGSAVYVSEEDADLNDPGCEGQPEPVVFQLPLEGGEAVRLGMPTGPVRGRLVPGPGDLVAVVDECEGFLQEVLVGTQAASGELQGLRVVPVEDENESLPEPRISAWSNDGSSLLAGGVSKASGDGVVATVDVDDGAITPLFGTGSGAGPGQVGQLSDGTYVVAADGDVTLRSADGEVMTTTSGIGFAIAPDGRRAVAYGETVSLLEPGSPVRVLLPAVAGRQVLFADVSPDGRAVAYAVSVGDTTEVAVLLVADGAVAPVDGPDGLVGRPTFSGDGRALAFNRFGREPPFANDVFVSFFGG